MADEITYYVFRADNCRFEGMTKEQILAAITQAVETGTIQNVDTGFVTKIKEQNSGSAVTLWVGTQAQYNALGTKEPNCLYIVTDDDTISTMQNWLNGMKDDIQNIEENTMVVDVSSAVSLSQVAQTGAALQTVNKKYIYSKALGVVFYNVQVAVHFTTAATGISLLHSGGYYSDRGNEPAAAYVHSIGEMNPAVAVYTVNDDETSTIDISWEKAKSGYTYIGISGFYFVRREIA